MPIDRRVFNRPPPNHDVGPLHAAPRCGSRTRAGSPCRAPAVRGKTRCRMHGGANGSGGQPGNGNAYRHGCYSATCRHRKRVRRKLLRDARATRQIEALSPYVGRTVVTRLMARVDTDPETPLPPEYDWRIFWRWKYADLDPAIYRDFRHDPPVAHANPECMGSTLRNGAGSDPDPSPPCHPGQASDASAIRDPCCEAHGPSRAAPATGPGSAGRDDTGVRAPPHPVAIRHDRAVDRANPECMGSTVRNREEAAGPAEPPSRAQEWVPGSLPPSRSPRWDVSSLANPLRRAKRGRSAQGPGMTTKGMEANRKSTPDGTQQRPPPAAALPVSTAADDPEAWWLAPGETPGKLWDSRLHGFDAHRRDALFVVPATIPGFDAED